jgi:WD repeat-containing protein 1 (actin-interacting protein 1)
LNFRMSITLEKTFASLPRTERGKFIVLGGHPKQSHYLYVNGNSVIIRNIQDDSDNDVYTQHSVTTTVAKYSPSGFYIASADIHGKIRIWDTTQKEHILTNEFQPFVGPVKDLSWSSDNQRICVGGEGREKFGAVFNAETGASTGEIMGMSRPVNSLDFRSERPFRLATAAEDNSTCFFEGPPFKFKSCVYKHTSFVNSLRFSPNGEFFATGGADGQLFLYDGKTGENLTNIGDPAHKGGIYSICFSPDSQHLLSVSGDKSVKVWKISRESCTLHEEYAFGNVVDNLLVGCLWLGKHILVVNLRGHIHVFEESVSNGPSRVIFGHNKPITGLLFAGGKLISSNMDGVVASWNTNTAEVTLLSKAEGGTAGGHTNQVQAMSSYNNTLVTVGIDDMIVYSSLDSNTFKAQVKLPSQPRSVSIVEDLVAVACYQHVVLLDDSHNILSKLDNVDFQPETVAISKDKHFLVVGSKESTTIRVYSIPSGGRGTLQLVSLEQPSLRGGATFMTFSPDGRYLAVSDLDRHIHVFQLSDSGQLSFVHKESWRFHVARVNCLAWSPDSERLASGSVYCGIYVWNVAQPTKRICMLNAHPTSQITGLAWISNEILFSSGQDCNIRQWKVSK